MPHALIIRTAGTNCDEELQYAFELAGASTELIHLDRLTDDPGIFERFDLLGIPGGFSYGDDLGAGKIFALLMANHLYPAFRRLIDRGVPIFAPCNGFQVLVKMGLLPGPLDHTAWPTERPPAQCVTLTHNAGGRFIDAWTRVEIDEHSPCVWTAGLEVDADLAVLPIAHGEGRFVTDDATLESIERAGLVCLRYAEGDNPNGSMNRIAGLCDRSGLIFGLMPHPERFTRWEHHPAWTRLDESTRTRTPLGLRMFENAVRHAESMVTT
ncbi:MAG: phosphoribosylformylglycinamidine synthase subunit PurQ [Phycisphaerales bacterium]